MFPNSYLVFFYRSRLLVLTDSRLYLMQTSCCTSRRASSPALLPSHQYFVKKNKKHRATLRRVEVDLLQPGDQHQKTIKIKAHQSWTVTAEGKDVSLEEHKTLRGGVFFSLPGEQQGSYFSPGGCHLDCYTAIPVCVYTSKKCCWVKLSIFSITDVSHIQTPQCKDKGLEAAVHPDVFHFWINDDSLYVHKVNFLWKRAHVMRLGREKRYKSAT